MINVEFYADFICPFCYCAEQGQLPDLIESFDLEVTWRPFELHPETPAQGATLPKADAGRIWGGYKRMAARWDLPISRKAPRSLPNTRAVLAGAEAARTAGRLAAYRAAAYDAYWVHGRDLSNSRVIAGLAEGLDLAAPSYGDMLATTRTAALRNCITAVPAMVVGGQVLFGLQEEHVVERFLRANT